MSVKIAVAAAVPAPEQKAVVRRSRNPRPPINLDMPGRLYVPDLLVILRVSRASLYAGLNLGGKAGVVQRYPRPDGFDQKRPYWTTQSIRAFLGGGQ